MPDNQVTEKITIRLPKKFLKKIDWLVKVDHFPTRSEAIRVAVRDMLYTHAESVPDKVSKTQRIEGAIAQMEETESKYMNR
jgi:Arc/MetJ-type ribon-helix-helix transcriptional regulator